MHRHWSDLNGFQRGLIVIGAGLELTLTAVAAVDLARRPPSQVHGRKGLWAMALVVQPVGPIAYLWTHRH